MKAKDTFPLRLRIKCQGSMRYDATNARMAPITFYVFSQPEQVLQMSAIFFAGDLLIVLARLNSITRKRWPQTKA